MIFAGVDVGSLTAEAMLLTAEGGILDREIIQVKPNPVTSATIVMEAVLGRQGLTHADVAFCVSTGYGRERIPFAGHHVSEISCHGRGGHWLNPSVRTLIDIGGQDCKVIRVDEQGDLSDFVMNDKCAAGTGRFLEGIAKTLGIPISELGPLSLRGKTPVPLSSICTVFAQFDVMCFLAEGWAHEDIGLGVSETLAARVMKLVKSVGVEANLCMTGGVAKNEAVRQAIEKASGQRIVEWQEDPQVVGALGAALFARERYERLSHRQVGGEGGRTGGPSNRQG
jgi:predicted CoA-substrate-specific enzyme activase